ncbi:MAG: type IV secretion system DNA-binding domain-containing protein [Alphaproteobacteria bacterium]|nr:type IV secretion system DNA-binding domain-containing protein [Alphaproteobacteria bacterium]
MGRRDRRGNGGRFIKPFQRGFGVLWNRTGHGLRAYAIGALALICCWVTIAPGYVWVVQPPQVIGAAARWAAAASLDEVGLRDWRWSVDTSGGIQRWRSAYVRRDPWHLAQADAVWASLQLGMLVATGVTAVLGVLGFILFHKIGVEVGAGRVIRGRRMTSDKALARSLKRQGVDSELAIGRVPLVKSMEPYNILLLGAQGTGKTSATEALFDGISQRGEPMVVYDYGPGLLQRYYSAERGDIILNPLDARCASWSPWAEIKSAADCAAIAGGFIPDFDQGQPFWGDAGRLLFAEVLDRLRTDPDRSVQKLLHVLLRMSREEIREIVKGTNAAKLYQEGGERTGTNVEIHASVYIKALGELRADAGGAGDFSITRYIEALDEPAPATGRPWLWMTTDPRSAPILKPLLSCWINAVAMSFQSLPERLDRRLWLALDELATLHDLPALPSFMQNGRKRGGCALITLQTPSQLRAIYRDADAQTILNGCQTHAIFRVSDPEGAEWASRMISSAEIEEVQESTRLHSRGDRGHEVSLSLSKRVSQLVLPAEIMMTPNCQCYVKLPADHPIALTEVKPRPPLSEADLTPGIVKRQDDSATAGAVLAGMPEAQTSDSPDQTPKSPPAAALGQLSVIIGGKDEGQAEGRERPAGMERNEDKRREPKARSDEAHPTIPGLLDDDRSDHVEDDDKGGDDKTPPRTGWNHKTC